jgi:ADP-heptose:LPS heptosyltransferase
MKEALVIRDRSLGDVIMVEPFFRALHKEGYNRIGFRADSIYQEVHRNNPLLTPECELQNPDVFELNGVYENRLDLLIEYAYLNHYGFSLPLDELKPRLYLSDGEYGGECKFTKGRWILFDPGYPGARRKRGWWPGKEWNPIVKAVKKLGYHTVIVANRENVQTIPLIEVDFRFKTSIRQLFSVINMCAGFIGMESGPMHVAEALNKPGIAIVNRHHPAEFTLVPGSSIIPVHRSRGDSLDCDEIIDIFNKKFFSKYI